MDLGSTRLLATLQLRPNELDGSTAWVGTVAGQPNSEAVFVLTDTILTGNVRVVDTIYTVRHITGRVHVIGRTQQSSFPNEAQPVRPPGADATPRPDASALACAPQTLDVLVVYTPGARDSAGGDVAITELAKLAIVESNIALDNSRVPHRFRLSRAGPIAYSREGNIYTDLNRLQTTTDGHMDQVHSLRQRWDADVVSLWVGSAEQSQDACGLGFLNTTLSADYGFNVVRLRCATGYYSFAHEIGHNLGLEHDRANAQSTPFHPFAYGYQDPERAFRTIMAYNCPNGGCVRIQRFSNPEVSVNGRPTGIDASDSRSADAAQSIVATVCAAAKWRGTKVARRSP